MLAVPVPTPEFTTPNPPVPTPCLTGLVSKPVPFEEMPLLEGLKSTVPESSPILPIPKPEEAIASLSS